MPDRTPGNGNGEPLARKVLFMMLSGLAIVVLGMGGGVLAHIFRGISQNTSAIKDVDYEIDDLKDNLGCIKESIARVETLQSEMRDSLREMKRLREIP